MADDANERDDAAGGDAARGDAGREPATSAAAPPAGAHPQGGTPPVNAPGSHRAAAEAAEEAFFARRQPGPGAAGDEELDPELLKLPRSRRRRHPLISVAVIALSVYLLLYLRHDVAFFFQPSKAHDLGDVADALRANKIAHNAYVTVRGAPDRKHALILESSFGGYESFYRLLQTSNRVFVRQHRKTRTVDREVEYEHTGRVVRFASVPYLQQLKSYFSRTMTHAHDLTFEAVRDAKRRAGAGPTTIRSAAGTAVPVRGETVVWINAEHRGEWVIQADRRQYPTEQQARAQLGALGMPYATDEERSHVYHRFVVLADDGAVTALRERFKDRALRISVVPRQVAYTVRWDRLAATDAGLRIDGHDPSLPARYAPPPGGQPPQLEPVRDATVALPGAAIRHLTVASKLAVPDDAVVIVTRDKPGDYWFYLALYAVLIAFVIFNGYALASRLIPRK